MIGTFRKHSKILWWIIIVAIIITFVWWGSSTSRTGDITVASDGHYGIMNGEVITPALFQETLREVHLNYFYASGGRWPGRGEKIPGFEEQRETFQRLLLIQKARELGIFASDEAVAQAANARMRAINRGNPVPVAEFERQVLAPERLNLGDFERFIRNELAIQQLISVVSAGGELVTPAEVESLYRQENQEFATQVVFFRATNDSSGLNVTPEQLGEFFTNRLVYYRVPERVQIDYVSYPLSNFLAAAQAELEKNTNLTEIIEARYEQVGGTNYYTEAKTPEEAKQKIRTEFANSMAMSNAAKEANRFYETLYEKVGTNYSSEQFAAIARELDLAPRVSEPFSINEPPASLDVSADFARRAFALTSEESFSEPLAGEDHLYVIGLHGRLPSEIPTLDSIRERVTRDYRFVEAAMAAQKAALDFYAQATNQLAAGKAFNAICTEAGVTPRQLSPISRASRNIPEISQQINEQEFAQAIFATEPGHVTPLLRSADGAALGYVEARLPIDENRMQTNLPAFTRNVQQMRRGEIFNEWFMQQANQAFATIPYFQRPAEMTGAQPQ